MAVGVEKSKIRRKLASAGPNGPQNQQITFADANRPQVIQEVTRRDGLSSWRVILYTAVEKLSGSQGGTNIYFSV